MDQDLASEYQRIKEEAGARTCKMQGSLDDLVVEQGTDQERLRSLEDAVKGMTERLQQLGEWVETDISSGAGE